MEQPFKIQGTPSIGISERTCLHISVPASLCEDGVFWFCSCNILFHRTQMNAQQKRTAEEADSLLEGVNAILVDIEGTTTPIDFVKVMWTDFIRPHERRKSPCLPPCSYLWFAGWLQFIGFHHMGLINNCFWK